MVECLTRGTNEYMHCRTAESSSLADLRAFVLLTAVKNQERDIVARLLQLTTLTNNVLKAKHEQCALTMAHSLASQQTKQILDERVLEEFRNERWRLSLFSWAVQCGHTSVVELLINENPSCNLADSIVGDQQGMAVRMTMLGLASFCGHEPVARILIANGADIQAEDLDGCKPLHRAASGGCLRVIKLLLRNGAKVGAVAGDYNNQPLHCAARQGHKEVVQLLLDEGASIDAKTSRGITAFMEATTHGHEATVLTLLDANPTLEDIEAYNEIYRALRIDVNQKLPNFAQSIISTLFSQAARFDEDYLDPSYYTGFSETRRQKMTLVITSSWVQFYLDSPHAYIEMLPETSLNIAEHYRRTFRFDEPRALFGDRYSILRFKFYVVYQHESALKFAAQYGSPGQVSLRIGNTRLKGSDNTQVFTDGNYIYFIVWSDVQLDPIGQILKPHKEV